MAAQSRLHVLVQDKARPNQPAETEHERGQPDHPGDRRLIGEPHLELSEVDLRLVARRRFDTDLECRIGRPKPAQQIRISPHSLAQVRNANFWEGNDVVDRGSGSRPLAMLKRLPQAGLNQKRENLSIPLSKFVFVVYPRNQAAIDTDIGKFSEFIGN